MTTFTFTQLSPAGKATIDNATLMMDTAGNAWFVTSDSTSKTVIVPAIPEQAAALASNHGAAWNTAVTAMQTLA